MMTHVRLLASVVLSIFILFSSITSAATADQCQEQSNALWKSGEALKNVGKCREAIAEYEQCIAIENTCAAPRSSRIAVALNQAGYCYGQIGQLDQAISYYQDALHIFQAERDQRTTAILLSNLGNIYDNKGDQNTALSYYQSAFELNQQLNNEEGMAINLNDMGSVSSDRGEYEAALQYYERALTLNKKLKLEKNIAINLNNIGMAHYGLGDYEQALSFYQEALTIHERTGNKRGIAIVESNVGALFHGWGFYANAQAAFEKALAINTELERAAGIAICLNNLGAVAESSRDYKSARLYYEKALALHRKSGQKDGIATSLMNLGGVYLEAGDEEKARRFYEDALALEEEIGNLSGIVTTLGNIGDTYFKSAEYAEALKYYESALQKNRDAGRERLIAGQLFNIGKIYSQQAQYEQARQYFQQALDVARAQKQHPLIANILNSVGLSYIRQERYGEAIPPLVESVSVKEGLRSGIRADQRKFYLDSEIYTYRFLALCYLKTGDIENAFKVMELTRAKRLNEQLRSKDADFSIPKLSAVRASLPPQSAVLMYHELPYDTNQILRILVTADAVNMAALNMNALNLSALQAPTPSAAANDSSPPRSASISGWEEGNESFWAKRRALLSDIAAYRNALTFRSLDERGLALNQEGDAPADDAPASDPKQTTREIGRQLYEMLFDEEARHALQGKTRLLISPDGPLTILPFETLIDEQGHLLIERFDIAYLPSLSVRQTLEARKYPDNRLPLLAIGGAVYDAETYHGEIADNEDRLAHLQHQTDAALERGRSTRDIYDELGYSWANLPGTLTEVQSIGEAIKHAEVITGEQASETTIRRLAASKKLQRYQRIHFATHGIANPDIPELSSLVLSLNDAAKEADDGYLNVKEVAKLPLQADFVNLSACETGLGRFYQGEGTTGLMQAFLLAGANGVSVSLWQVADESTSAFMVAFYKLLPEFQNDYIKTLSEVKRRFARGDFGEEWAHPYFWAPFVYYGK